MLPVSRAALAALSCGKPIATSMPTSWLSTRDSSTAAPLLPEGNAAVAETVIGCRPDVSAGCDRSHALLCSAERTASAKAVMFGANIFNCSMRTDPFFSAVEAKCSL